MHDYPVITVSWSVSVVSDAVLFNLGPVTCRRILASLLSLMSFMKEVTYMHIVCSDYCVH